MASKRQWLARQVAARIEKRLSEPMRPGGRLPSVRKLAEDMGVCVETVRAAQRLLAGRGVLEIRHGSGAYVTEGTTSRWVGIYTAFNILQPRAASFHVLAPHFLREFLNRKGLEAEVYIGASHPSKALQPQPTRRFVADVESGRLSAVAILTAPRTHEWKQLVESLEVPAIGAHTPYRLDVCYGKMVTQAVRHLCQQGCRRIAMLSWFHDGLRQVLCDALSECGLEYRPEWVRHDLHPMLSGAGWEEFREVWLARHEKPDGLLVTDDVLFEEVRVAIQELGIRVPDQLRIVTHANKGADRRYPFPVTLAQRDTQRYAEALGELLIKRMRAEPVAPGTTSFPFEMVEGAAAQGGTPVAAHNGPTQASSGR